MRKSLQNSTIALCICLIIALNLYQIYIGKERNNHLKVLKEQLETCQYEKDSETYFLENITIIAKLQHYAEGKVFDDFEIQTIEGERVHLSDLAAGQKKLIYYISERGCSMCYKPFLHKLSLLVDEMGNDKIIVLAMFNKSRALKAFLQNEKVGLTIYRITEEPAVYPESNDYSFAFMLTKDMSLENVHITDKSNQPLSDDYLSIMQKRLAEE